MAMQTIHVNGKEIKYTVKRGDSIKYVTLKFLSEDKLEIILPKKGAINIKTLLKNKTLLIQRKHAEYISHQKTPEVNKSVSRGRQHESIQEDKLLLFGKSFDIEINNEYEEYKISLKDNKIKIQMPESTKGQELEYLRKWMKRKLLRILHDYLNMYKRKMKTSINRLYIKNQKTRWASYSPKHNINFNIKLAALPPKIIEYIVIHELAHAKIQRHNKGFWYTVRKFCPDYKERRQELKTYSFALQKNKIWQRTLKT
jgi:predicted metal-dependent hydrolase